MSLWGTKVGLGEGRMNSKTRDEPGLTSPIGDPESLAVGSVGLWGAESEALSLAKGATFLAQRSVPVSESVPLEKC
jgi:hypothetical protein